MQSFFTKKRISKLAAMFFLALLTTVFLWQYLNQYLVGSKAGASSVTLSLIPSTWNFNAREEGKEFQLIAQFQNGSASEKINYLKARIDFPKDSLELPANAYVITTDSGLDRQIRVDGPVAANGSGQIIIELGASAGAGPATNSQPVTIAKIKFKVKTANATGAITIEGVKIYNNSEAEITQVTKNNATFSVGGDGTTPTPTVTPGGPTLTPTPIVAAGNAKLNLKLKFQGITSKPAGVLNKLNVKVKLYNETTNQETDYKTAEFTADDAGVWSGNTTFDVNVNAKYVLYVKGPYHIQKKICASTPTETAGGTYRCIKGSISFVAGDNNIDLFGILLLGGDLPDQDGTITAYDTSLIRNNLGKTDNDKCDINRDGRCDTQDHSLIIESLSVKNDEL